MIEIHLSPRATRKLRRELKRAGQQEIGGVLAAQHTSERVFTIIDLSVQRSGGNVASFIRSSPVHRRFIRQFMLRMGNEFSRYNYLGEWHSHPSFLAQPSGTDLRQMQRLIEEPTQQANFLVLLIVKLARTGRMETSAHAFRRHCMPIRLPVHAIEDSPDPARAQTKHRPLKDVVALRYRDT